MVLSIVSSGKCQNERLKKIYGLVVFGLCLSCIVIRAHYSAITLDEAHTYVDYVEKFRLNSIGDFFSDYDGRANNHLLNTVLIYLVNFVTNIHYDEFLIRLPNVCFGAFFCFFCFSLYRRREISTFVFSMLMLNESVNAIFSLARGYGMATCLTMIAFYYAKCYVEGDYKENKYLSKALLLFSLAESANTVVLLITASVGLVLLGEMLRKKVLVSYIRKSWRFLIPVALLNLLLLAYHIYVSLDGEGKALRSYYGNPFDNIIGCFIGMYTGRFVGIGTVIFVTLLLVATLFGIVKKTKLFFTYSFVVYFIVCGIMAVVLGKGMPSGVILLPTCPLMVFALLESTKTIWDNTIKKICPAWEMVLWTMVTVIFSGLFIVHFVRETDFMGTRELRTNLYNSIMGSYEGAFDSEEMHTLHIPFYHRQFFYRYGYDIYEKEYSIVNMSLDDTLRMLENRRLNVLMEINDREALSKYAHEFKKLGIDIKSLPEGTDFIAINYGAKTPIEYLCNIKNSDHIQETIMGTMSLFYGENGAYGVYVDGQECIVVDEDELEHDVGICVWNEGDTEPLHYKLFGLED